MNLSDLIKWHKRELARLERSGVTAADIDASKETEALVAVHWDAVRLLEWCVELPCIDTTHHAKLFALETLSSMLSDSKRSEEDFHREEMNKGADEDETEAHLMLSRFFNGLDANMAERINELQIMFVDGSPETPQA